MDIEGLRALADRLATEAKVAGCRAVIVALSFEGERESTVYRVTTAGPQLEVEGLAQRAVSVAAQEWQGPRASGQHLDSLEERQARAKAYGAGDVAPAPGPDLRELAGELEKQARVMLRAAKALRAGGGGGRTDAENEALMQEMGDRHRAQADQVMADVRGGAIGHLEGSDRREPFVVGHNRVMSEARGAGVAGHPTLSQISVGGSGAGGRFDDGVYVGGGGGAPGAASSPATGVGGSGAPLTGSFAGGGGGATSVGSTTVSAGASGGAGRPVVLWSGVPVKTVVDQLAAGRTAEQVASDYGVTLEEVRLIASHAFVDGTLEAEVQGAGSMVADPSRFAAEGTRLGAPKGSPPFYISAKTIAQVAMRCEVSSEHVQRYLASDEQDDKLLSAFLSFGVQPAGKRLG